MISYEVWQQMKTDGVARVFRWLSLPVLLLPYLGQQALYFSFVIFWFTRNPVDALDSQRRGLLFGMANQFAYDINVSYFEYAFNPVTIGRLVLFAASIILGLATQKPVAVSRVASFLLLPVALFVPATMVFDPFTLGMIPLFALSFNRQRSDSTASPSIQT